MAEINREIVTVYRYEALAAIISVLVIRRFKKRYMTSADSKQKN